MAIHIVFIILYVILSGLISGVELCMISCLHMVLFIINSFRKQESVSPITLFAVGAIFVNIGNISLIDKLRTGTITTYSYIVPKYVDAGALIWCISCGIIIIGYTLAAKKSLPAINFDLNTKYFKPIFSFLLILNLVFIFYPEFDFRRSVQAFSLLNIFAIMFYARLWTAENNKTYAKYAITLMVVETYLALVTAYLRSEVIFPFISLAIGYFLGKKNIMHVFSYRIIPFLLIGTMYAIVFSALEARRSNFLGYFLENKQNNPYVSTADDPDSKKDELLTRSANIAQITNVINLVKQNGFYNGRASAPLVLAVIPRVLWPDKPSIRLGAWFALEIGQANISAEGAVNNSINMTVMGEMYLDFGWIGVVIGSLILGAIIAVLWNSAHFYLSEANLPGTLFGGYILIIMLLGVAADLQIVITFFSMYFSFLLLKYIWDNVSLKSK